MRRLAFLLILLLLIPSISQASPRGIFKTVASGTVTKDNMRLSGVDGLAFVDFGAANVLTTKVGHLLKITDSAGKSIMGYIKAAGSSETVGDELITGWTNLVSAPFATFTVNANGHDVDSFIADSTSDAAAITNSNMTLGGLYKVITDITVTSGNVRLRKYYGLGNSANYVATQLGDSTLYTTAQL